MQKKSSIHKKFREGIHKKSKNPPNQILISKFFWGFLDPLPDRWTIWEAAALASPPEGRCPAGRSQFAVCSLSSRISAQCTGWGGENCVVEMPASTVTPKVVFARNQGRGWFGQENGGFSGRQTLVANEMFDYFSTLQTLLHTKL